MIEVKYSRKKHIVTVKGHAKSGEAGRDLICAAASILVYTLASNVSQICSENKNVRRPVIDLNDGNATIKCSTVHGMDSVVTLVFDSICSGFDMLATRYPDNVKYIVLG